MAGWEGEIRNTVLRKKLVSHCGSPRIMHMIFLQPRKIFVQPNTHVVDGEVQLKEYPLTAAGVVQSFVERKVHKWIQQQINDTNSGLLWSGYKRVYSKWGVHCIDRGWFQCVWMSVCPYHDVSRASATMTVTLNNVDVNNSQQQRVRDIHTRQVSNTKWLVNSMGDAAISTYPSSEEHALPGCFFYFTEVFSRRHRRAQIWNRLSKGLSLVLLAMHCRE